PAGDAEARCAAGVAIARALGSRAPFVAHPWPVTPYHDDYVQQYDLVQRARERSAGAVPRVRAAGVLKSTLSAAGISVTADAQATAGCERVVLGYTLRREALNADYNEGVENIAVDSQAGVASPIFLRTVKLKDFPWNGWLHVGAEGGARAAWNPVAGFSDPAG